MNIRILAAMLLISAAAHAQPLPNHTFVNQQYRWVGGVFNNELKVPGYSGFPYTKPLTHAPMNGDIAYDSVNHRFYFRSGGTYRRLADSAFVMTNALNFANSNLTLTGSRQHDFDNNAMDWLSVDRFQIYSDASSTSRLLINSTNSDLYSPNQSGSVSVNNARVAINGPDSVRMLTDKLLIDSLPQTTDTTSWKQLVWNRTTNEVREFPYFVGGNGSGDLTYAVFEDTCLIITDGAGSDTVCFSGGSGVQYAEFLDSIAAIRQLVVDSAAAIRADFPAASGGNPFADNTDLVKGSADATKLLRFEVDGFTTGTTRTWTVPDVNGTLARSDAAQTFTGVQTFSSNPTFSATSANRVLYTTTGGAVTSTANFNFDGSFGRLAGQWSIGAVHSGTANRNFEVTGYVNYANATAIGSFIPYQQYGGWDGIGTISPSANILALGGYRASQWIGVNIYTGAVERISMSASSTVVNETGVDNDFRVEGDNDANALVVDASTDRVGIGVAPASTTEKLHVSGNIRFSGALMPNNAAGSTGQVLTSAGTGAPPTWATPTTVLSGTYTPTLTNTTNISSSTANVTGYHRVGDRVTVSGTLSVTPTAELSACELGVSLPVASAIANPFEGGGAGALESATTNNSSVGIKMDATNDRATFTFHAPSDGSAIVLTFTFSYTVI